MPKNAFAELGMNSEILPRKAQKSAVRKSARPYPVIDNDKDYFVERDGVRFAGTHLLVDLWGASNLADPKAVESALVEASRAAKATILYTHFHHFSPNGGVSGVVVLAESHVSIHTWPERSFAAVDIFMCGSCDPYKALPVLRKAFKPSTMDAQEQRRGVTR